MNSPSFAFAWELWTRHHRRLITMVALLVAFATLYPWICSLSGLDLAARDALDSVAATFQLAQAETGVFQQFIRALVTFALVCGPAGVMLISLLVIMWMSTFTTFDPASKDGMAFPMRLFRLPVTTSFLFWWMTIAGQLGIVVCHACWIHFVRMPNMEVLGAYQNRYIWMTLLALTQGITWSLAGWPVLRTCLLGGLGLAFVMSPAWNSAGFQPTLLGALAVGGMVLGRVGLGKIRHGQWQSLDWDQVVANFRKSGELRGPAVFASPEQAQLWFEWRRFGRRFCIYAAVSTIVPTLVLVVARYVFIRQPLNGDTIFRIGIIVAFMPVAMHLCFSLTQPVATFHFPMLRPITSGQIIMANLKASGIFTAVSWILAGSSLAVISLLGKCQLPDRSFALALEYWPITVVALAFLCWRFIAVNLGFALTDRPRLKQFPALFFIGAYALAFGLAVLSHYEKYWSEFLQWLPVILACLAAVKLSLGVCAFWLSIKRNVLSSHSAGGYLVAWCVMAAAVMTPVLVSFHGQEGVATALLGIIVLTPLARVGFAPLGLELGRHQ